MLKNVYSRQFLLNSLLISYLFFLTFFCFYKPSIEIVYVDNQKIFDGFVMTKEMKRAGEKEFNSRKLFLDKLYSNLQSPTISGSQKKELMQQFIQGKEELEEFNQTFAAEQSTQIWSRIKSYSIEFSKEKKYQLIIGSDAKQNILFADENIDVTNELLNYINKKYEGL
ncbi:OmpH family outer membrane protein [Flavobacterium polysaccharolyticum]|uniref:OmpH family outer membrane protein n=1 Tax=Flavobacterium polysaccharolyticum TaxID=3133148 RepID=A0ABU9NUP4_9FLAO